MLAKNIHESGSYPVYSANVYEPFGFTEELLITDFSKPSIIWGIDGDWQVNLIPQNTAFYPTDHCGVLRLNTDNIHPRYMAWALEKAGKTMRFSRNYRASMDRIESITLNMPSKQNQWEAMSEVESLEKKIRELELSVEKILSRKRTIISKYL